MTAVLVATAWPLAAAPAAEPGPETGRAGCKSGLACRMVEAPSPAAGKAARLAFAAVTRGPRGRHICDEAAGDPFNPDTAAFSMARAMAATHQFAATTSLALIRVGVGGLPCGETRGMALQHLYPVPAAGAGTPR